MQPFLMSSGFDPFQVAVIVIFVLASFIKWLWENWQLKREAARRGVPPERFDDDLREEVLRRQQGPASPAGLPPPAPQQTSSWEELRKAWQEIKEAAAQAQRQPAAPPPLPEKKARADSVRHEMRQSRPAAPARPEPTPATLAEDISTPPPPHPANSWACCASSGVIRPCCARLLCCTRFSARQKPCKLPLLPLHSRAASKMPVW